jgi:hypothetical protein
MVSVNIMSQNLSFAARYLNREVTGFGVNFTELFFFFFFCKILFLSVGRTDKV